MSHGNRNRQNELALVDEMGNTVGLLVANDQSQYPVQNRSDVPVHLKYPVPCTKLANVTVEWLKENFHENKYNSLPRIIMFEEYTSFCYGLEMKPFNQAVFGKIVRACFPNLTTRRLGVRGQSRYHYAGLDVTPTSRYVHRFKQIQEKRNNVRAVNSRMRKKKIPTVKQQVAGHSNRAEKLKMTKSSTIILDSHSLTTSTYPCASDVDLKFNWSLDVVKEFLKFYVDFNNKLFNLITTLDFEKTMDHLRSFITNIPENCQIMVESTEICRLIFLCDDVLYQQATVTLLPDCLATLSTEFNVSIRKYAKTLPIWINETCEEASRSLSSINPSVFQTRITAAKIWCDYVRRVTTLCHVTKEARKTLADPGVVVQLLRNLQTLSMNDTVEQCSFASCYNYQKDSETAFKETSNDRWKSKELVMAFTKLLEKMVSVERFAVLIEKIVNENAGMLTEPKPNSPEECFQVITEQTRLFMMKWSMYGSKMLAEITLKASESVGTFHLVMLLFGDYVNHVICLRQERADRLKRKCEIIKKDSAYLLSVQRRALTKRSSGKQQGSCSAFSQVVSIPSQPQILPNHQVRSRFTQPTQFFGGFNHPPSMLSHNQPFLPPQSQVYPPAFYQPVPAAVFHPGQPGANRFANHNMPNNMMVDQQIPSNHDASSYYLLTPSNPTNVRTSTDSASSGESKSYKKL